MKALCLSLLLLFGAPLTWGNDSRSTYLAQSDDDSFDPFADFSEYDDSEQEEADIHFFRQGRFLSMGLAMGQRFWTGNLAKLYGSGPTMGLFLAYFFDFRFAMQVGILFGDYGFEFAGEGSKTTGTVSLSMIPFNLKYYFNNQNVYKGLADLNPYAILGFSQVYRTYTVPAFEGFGRDGATGLDIGAGLEVPILNRKAFAGIQLAFHYVNFKGRGEFIVLPDGTPTSARPNGDTMDILALLGFNF